VNNPKTNYPAPYSTLQQIVAITFVSID